MHDFHPFNFVQPLINKCADKMLYPWAAHTVEFEHKRQEDDFWDKCAKLNNNS